MGFAEGFPFRGWQKLLLTNHILKISEWGYHPRIRFEIFRTGFEGDKNARTEVGKTPRTPLWKFQHGVRGWGSFAGGKNGRTLFWKFQNGVRGRQKRADSILKISELDSSSYYQFPNDAPANHIGSQCWNTIYRENEPTAMLLFSQFCNTPLNHNVKTMQRINVC